MPNESHVAAVVQGMYSIWRARNESLYNQTLADPPTVMLPGFQALAQWREAQPVEGHMDEHCPNNPLWKAPPQGILKLNLDAGWTGNSCTGMGFVVRSSSGEALLAATQLEENRLEPLIAEATAMRWALAQATGVELNRVIVESDSEVVVRAMKSRSCPPQIEMLIEDCKQLALNFTYICFEHTKREANAIAHLLASKACEFPSNMWWENRPSWLIHALLVDSTFEIICLELSVKKKNLYSSRN
ncbi:uncharacterized protein LOC130724900 [Lotus japonicus]|uniref:uncharacterized protein LOC130724900 n=1 Tax=Lotus japonicus TaxID=34305 RepID=UPI00258EEEDB|nr:uncharacterized protein LOC130724900 [Lotus japonicus]